MPGWLLLPGILVISYLIGSIPFGVIIGKAIKGIDIRDTGSGNIGAANAFRALGPAGGLLVLCCDVLKGVLCAYLGGVFVSPEIASYMIISSGIAGILGHNYSIFLGGKGGKGIATSLGVLIYISWIAAVIGVAIWGVTVLITRYSSAGSVLASFSIPFVLYFLKCPPVYVIFGALSAATAIYKHRGNIKRLSQGKELKITDKTTGKGGTV
ncbi:MAG: glycerol-3-phosphate 1-O-acyltransferase PlsY [Chloroflexi bacterium]|nr:glycerol-3-phosphate 1-O-acyltransferase PlsY [Chloroflexota bacterium]